MERDEVTALSVGVEIERAKQRCRAVIDRVLSLPPKPSYSSYRTLLRLAHSELSFLSRFSSPNLNPTSLSSNIGYLEAVVRILQRPFVNGVSRVCKPISLSALVKNGEKTKPIHVDIVCTLNGKPVWFLVSARNPKYVSWDGSSGSKGLRTRIQQVLDAAARSSAATKPCLIILFFSKGLDDSICGMLEDEFGAFKFDLEFPDFDIDFVEESEGEWIHVLGKSYQQVCVLQIKVDHVRDNARKIECGVKGESLEGAASNREHLPEEYIALDLGDSFCGLILRMNLCPLDAKYVEFNPEKDLLGEAELINFDTTALIALISGISNGSTEKLLAKSESELRQRFKGNVDFVISQVMSEIQNPIHVDLEMKLSGKRGMICESVCLEFKELVSMCGGSNEKSRADYLLKHLLVVCDSPSTRMMSLPTTRKLAFKNKVVFGTGDYWRAPTLTANMAFVRAVTQMGMSLFIMEHRPRALIGD